MINTENLNLSDDSMSKPVQIYKELRRQIVHEELKPGSRLPSVPKLCQQLNVSKATINRAVELLLCDGYVQTFVGSGAFVCGGIQRKDIIKGVLISDRQESIPIPFSIHGDRLAQIDDMSPGDKSTASEAILQSKQVSWNYWRRACTQAVEELASGGSEFMKLQENSLRHEIAVRLSETRGVVCRPKQVIPLPSRESALNLIIRMHVNEGDLVAFQDPVMFSMRSALLNQGAEIFELPATLSEEKLCAIPAAVWQKMRMMYLTPSCAFPTGETMPLKTRTDLLSLAVEHEKLLIEDDFFVEYSASGLSTRPLQAIASACGASAIYVSSLEPIFADLCQAAFLVVPLELSGVYRKTANQLGMRLSATDTIVLNHLFSSGDFERMTIRTRADAVGRQKAMVKFIEKMLPFAKIVSSGMLGISMNVTVDTSPEAETLATLCHALNLRSEETHPGSYSEKYGYRKTFRVHYSCVDTKKLEVVAEQDTNTVVEPLHVQKTPEQIFIHSQAPNAFAL